MADNLDKLLYSIGEGADANVGYDEMYQAILAESARKRSAGHRAAKYLSMAAVCVILLGTAAMLPGYLTKGQSSQSALTSDAAAPADECAIVEEEAAVESYAMEDAPTETTAGEGGREAAPLEEAESESLLFDDAASEDTAQNSGGTDQCCIDADTGEYLIGIPDEGLEQRLEAICPGVTILPFEKSGIPEGYAAISVSRCENTALWNTGSGVLYIEAGSVGSAEDFAFILRSACTAAAE